MGFQQSNTPRLTQFLRQAKRSLHKAQRDVVALTTLDFQTITVQLGLIQEIRRLAANVENDLAGQKAKLLT